MSSEAAADLCRVTLVAPRGRFDLALPAAVPLAYLLPTLLRQAGEDLAEAGTGHGGWALQRVGGWPLDTGQSAAALQVRDGEVLYLRPRRQEIPPPVFDDVAEAISATLAERTRRWQPGMSAVAGRIAAGAMLALGLIPVVLAGPPWPVPATVAGGLALALLFGAAALSRAFGNAAGGAVLGLAAAAYALLGGLIAPLPAGAPITSAGPADLRTGVSAAAVVVVLAAAAVGGAEPAFLATGLVSVVVLVASLVTGVGGGHAGAAGVAAVADGLVFLISPAIPALAYRLARLPAAFVPATAEQLRDTTATMPGTEISERSVLADRYLTALLAGSTVVVAAATPFLVRGAGVAGPALAAAVGGLALLRLRLYSGMAQRAWLIGAGLVAALAGAVTLVATAGGAAPRLGLTVALFVLAVAVLGLSTRPRTGSPLRSRALDLVEILCAVATIPLVLDVVGVYAFIRSRSG